MLKIIYTIAALLSSLMANSQEIKLSLPKANQSFVMLSDNTDPLKFDFRMDGAVIKYTTDGTDPSPKSLLYNNELSINKACTVKARAFHPDFLPSDVITTVFVHQGKKIKIIKANAPNEKYNGNASTTLYDGIFGDMDFKKDYFGYDGNALIAEIYPIKSGTLSKVNVSSLVNQGSWIFGPASIRVTDINGKLIGEKINANAQLQQNPSHMIHTVAIKKKKYNYLKITIQPLGALPEWHDGMGNKAWLFVDEVWVE
jgi:Fn3 associated